MSDTYCQETELKWFEKCCELNEKLFDYLKLKLADYKPQKYYTMSYYSQFKISPLSNVNITLKGIEKYNTSISLGNMMYETKTPYRLCLWKYNGEHTFKDIELETISENDFETYLRYITDFFKIKKCRYEQLSLFD